MCSNNAYSITRWSRSRAPLLESVPRAYVLTLRTSDRLLAAHAARLKLLCSQTFVQVNDGFRMGDKPSYIDSTAKDLIHAYQNVCRDCAHIDGPVLIMEDDAMLFEADASVFREIDAFVKTKAFDVYSLASIGPFDRSNDQGPHRMFRSIMGFSQAIIWSRASRASLLSQDLRRDTHIDVHILSKFTRKFTYERPVVVQLFPTTENMETWCIRCDDEDCFEPMLVKAWQWTLQRVLYLDRTPDGWRTIYLFNTHAESVCKFVSVSIAVAIIALLHNAKKKSARLSSVS